jgi:hypothetical protein
MATNHINVGHAPYFDGDESNFDYWKTCMRIHLKAVDEIICKVVDEGYAILDEANPTQVDNENLLANAQAMMSSSVLYVFMSIIEFASLRLLMRCGGSL